MVFILGSKKNPYGKKIRKSRGERKAHDKNNCKREAGKLRLISQIRGIKKMTSCVGKRREVAARGKPQQGT